MEGVRLFPFQQHVWLTLPRQLSLRRASQRGSRLLRYLVVELCETRSETARWPWDTSWGPSRSTKSRKIPLLFFFFLLVCFVSLSPSLVILTRSAACFPDGALMLPLTEEKVLSRAPLTSLRRWEKKGPCKTVSQLQQTLINAAGKQLLRHPESVIDPPSVTTTKKTFQLFLLSDQQNVSRSCCILSQSSAYRRKWDWFSTPFKSLHFTQSATQGLVSLTFS